METQTEELDKARVLERSVRNTLIDPYYIRGIKITPLLKLKEDEESIVYRTEFVNEELPKQKLYELIVSVENAIKQLPRQTLGDLELHEGKADLKDCLDSTISISIDEMSSPNREIRFPRTKLSYLPLNGLAQSTISFSYKNQRYRVILE